jgi:hypothetical protein
MAIGEEVHFLEPWVPPDDRFGEAAVRSSRLNDASAPTADIAVDKWKPSDFTYSLQQARAMQGVVT